MGSFLPLKKLGNNSKISFTEKYGNFYNTHEIVILILIWQKKNPKKNWDQIENQSTDHSVEVYKHCLLNKSFNKKRIAS